MSNAMRFGKRTLAGVAAGALALGTLAIASAPAASAKPSIKPKAVVTTAVAPVRVSFSGTALEAVPYSQISWTSTFALGAGDTAVVTLTSAPSASAQLNIADYNKVGTAVTNTSNSITSGDDTLSLGSKPESDQQIDIGVNGGYRAGIAVAANTAGVYGGSIKIYDSGNLQDTATFSFTTTGRATSMTLTPASQGIPVGGVAELNASLKDASGNLTQPLSVDSVILSGAGGTFDPVSPLNADDSTELALGSADFYWTNSGVSGAYAITATPAGTLSSSGVTTQTATVTVSGTITDDSVASLVVATPKSTAPTGTQPSTATTIPTGSTSITVNVTGRTGQAGKTFNFRATSPNRPTASSPSATAGVFASVTLDASLKGSVTFPLSGGATTAGANITIQQVKANLVDAVTGVQLVAVQTDPAVVPASVIPNPNGGIVAKLGTSTTVNVAVTDQFGNPSVGAVVRAYRTSTAGTLLSTGTTNSTGIAAVTVSGSAGITTGTVETYVFSAQPIGVVTPVDAALTLAVTYTTSGDVNAVTVTLQSNTGATNPITNTSTGINLIPAIQTPFNGVADTNGGNTSVWNIANSDINTGGALSGNRVELKAVPSPANTVTVTTPEGVFVSDSGTSAAKLAWNAGTRSVTVSSNDSVWIFATKTGTHEVSFTSGAVTTKVKIHVIAPPQSAYNVALSPATQELRAGSFGTATLTVTDVFGNKVPDTVAGTGDVLLTATGEVLLSGLNAALPAITGADGTATVTLIAGKAGEGTVSVAPYLATTNLALAWRAGYVPPTGAPAPVKSASIKVKVTPDVTKSITITGSRTTVSGKPGIKIDGAVTAIENGKTVIPYFRFPGETTFAQGSARPVIEGGKFTWQRKTGKKFYAYVTSDDGAVTSNRVIIPAN